MHYLTDSNITRIANYLKEENICYSHLYDDLMDHICCEIEEVISDGVDFESAFNTIKQTIGNNGLKDIQDATIFYVKLNLLVMKKTVKVLGIITSTLMITGLFFKTMHWPGASIMVALGTLILLAGFTPFALFSLRRDDNLNVFSGKFLAYMAGFICLTETGLAMLFKFNHWPGGSTLTVISWILVIFVLFPLIFIHIHKYSEKKLISYTLLLFAFLVFTMPVIQSINRQVFKGNIYRYTVTDMNDETNYYSSKIVKLEPYSSDKEEIAVLNKSLSANLDKINEILSKLLNGTKDITELNSTYLKKGDNTESYLAEIRKLSVSVQEYSSLATELAGKNEIAVLIEHKLEPFTTEAESVHYLGWFNLNFIQASKVDIYNNLSRLKKDLLMVHSEILQDIILQKKS